MYVNTKPNDIDILKSIRSDLDAGKNVSVNCCSKKLARSIRELGLSLCLKTAIYDGDNNRVIHQFDQEMTMGNHKKQQLANPNEYWS